MKAYLLITFLFCLIKETLLEIPIWKNTCSHISITVSKELIKITGYSDPLITASLNKENRLYYYQSPTSISLIKNSPITDLSLATKLENQYILCGQSKELYSFDLSKPSTVIKIPDPLEDMKDAKSPKCYYEKIYEKNKEIVSALFINTNIFYYYDGSKWSKIMDVEKQSYDIIQKQLSVDKNRNYFYSFSIEGGNYYKLKTIQFDNGSGSSDNSQTIQVKKVYSKSIIDIRKDLNLVLIFTYEPNQALFYYYVYTLDKNDNPEYPKYVGCTITLPVFRLMKIIKAEFITYTGVLAYHIKDSNNIDYTGTVDLMHNLLIYNIKETFDSFSIKQASNDVDHLFYYLFQSNTIYKICPFAYVKDSQDETQIKCIFPIITSTQKLQLDQVNNNKLTLSCNASNKSLGRYCVPSCPIGFIIEGSTCNKCGKDKYYEDGKCVAKCSQNKAKDENNICYSCKDEGLKYYNGNCITSCADVYAQDDDSICSRCKDSGKWYEKGKCVTECKAGSEKQSDNNNCVKCSEINKVLNKAGICADKCDIYEHEGKERICSYCKELQEDKPYDEKGTCVSKCSIGNGYNINPNACLSCKENKKVYYDSQCFDKCPLYYINNDSICSECPAKRYYEDDKCVSECKKGSEIIPDSPRHCLFCKDQKKYYSEGKCLDKCPQYEVSNEDDHICYSCTTKKQKYQNETCVDECSEPFGINDMPNVCQPCDELGFYYYEQKCLQECPDYYFVYIRNVCQKCHIVFPQQPYFYKGTCNSKCPSASVVDDKEYICYRCKDNNTYYDERRKESCLKECDKDQGVEELNNQCLNCYETTQKLVEKGTCVDDCSIGYVQQYKPKCLFCKDQQRYFSKKECVLSCPSDTYYDKKNVCKLCYCSSKGSCPQVDHPSCVCDKDYFGQYCEIKEVKKSDIEIIINKLPVIQSRYNSFEIKLTDPSEEGYSLKWVFNKESDYDDDSFITGFNESRFVIDENKLTPRKANEIKVIKKNSKGVKSEAIIEVYVTPIKEGRFQTDITIISEKAFGGIDQETIPLKTIVKLEVEDIDQRKMEDEGFQYRWYYLDETLEQLPFTAFSPTTTLQVLVPVTSMLVTEIMNSRGEKITLHYPMIQSPDMSYDTNIQEIIEMKGLNKDIIINLKNYFIQIQNRLSKEEEKVLLEYIKGFIDKTVSFNENDISLETSVLSLLNAYVIRQTSITNQGDNNPIDSLENCNILMKEYIDINYKTNKNVWPLKEDVLLSIFRNIDTMINIASLLYTNENSLDKLTFLNEQKESIIIIKNYIAGSMHQGQQIIIKCDNFHIHLDQPSREQTIYALIKEPFESFPNFSSYSFKYKYKISSCDDTTFFCIDYKYYQTLQSEVTALTSYHFNELVFGIIQMNKNLHPHFNQVSDSFLQISIYHPPTNLIIDTLNSLEYTVRIPLSVIKTYNNDTNELTCAHLNDVDQIETDCTSYFDLNTLEAVCHCLNGGVIGVVRNFELAKASKNRQFKKAQLKTYNYVSGTIVFTSLGLIIICSLLFLLYDNREQKELNEVKEMPDNKRIKYEYQTLRHLFKTNQLAFAWYLTHYQFSLLSIFLIYHHNSPRYFRFFAQVLLMILSLFISVLPYYYFEFNLKTQIFNMRYSTYLHWSINNLPVNITYWFDGFFCSFVASIITLIISAICQRIFKTHKIHSVIWKPKLDYLKGYIYNEIKKDVLLSENWHKIRNRMIVVSYFYRTIINQRKDDHAKNKYAKYLQLKKRQFDLSEQALTIKKVSNNEIDSRSNFNIDVSLPLLSNINDNDNENDDDDILNYYKQQQKTNRCSEGIQNTINIQQTNNFMLSNHSHSSKNYETINKFSKIKNKYMSQGSEDSYNEEEQLDEELEEDNTLYQVSKEEDVTYLNELSVETKKRQKQHLNKIFGNVFINVLLVGFLIFLYVGIMILFKKIYTKYEYFIIKAWLVPALVQMTVFSFLLSYIINLFLTVILFSTTPKTKNWFIRIIYYLWIEKYMIYLNKIRFLITKYKNEFESME